MNNYQCMVDHKLEIVLDNEQLNFIQGQRELAIYAPTSRGRIQLIYGGQPFIFEKFLKLTSGDEKKYWRCNQWWNQRCRSRVYTINDVVVPLNKYHTHEEIIKRKKRVKKSKPCNYKAIVDEINDLFTQDHHN